MPSNRPVDRAVSIDVVVTLPISRVEFGGMPDTVQVSSVVEATLRVTDQAGRLIDGAPVVMRNGDASWIAGSVTAGSGRMRIHGPSGQRMLIATFGGQSDTAYVYVARRPPR